MPAQLYFMVATFPPHHLPPAPSSIFFHTRQAFARRFRGRVMHPFLELTRLATLTCLLFVATKKTIAFFLNTFVFTLVILFDRLCLL